MVEFTVFPVRAFPVKVRREIFRYLLAKLVVVPCTR
jgi:hypothetical protein